MNIQIHASLFSRLLHAVNILCLSKWAPYFPNRNWVHNNFVLADLSFSFLSSYLIYSADPRERVEDKCPNLNQQWDERYCYPWLSVTSEKLFFYTIAS